MALKHRPATWPWYLLLAAILIGLVTGLWVATKRVHYEWRWERVPQYFAYRAEVPQESPIAGRVSAIQADGALSRVVVTPADGGAPVVLPVETVQVAVGDTLDREDSVGDNHEWRARQRLRLVERSAPAIGEQEMAFAFRLRDPVGPGKRKQRAG